MKNVDLDRLLRSAAQAGGDDEPIEMPFGFDTRVVALSRRNGNGAAFAILLRRITLIAATLIILAGAGAYFELNQSRDVTEGIGNEFAFADSAIQNEVSP